MWGERTNAMKSAVDMNTLANKLNYEYQSTIDHESWKSYAKDRFIDERITLECNTKVFITIRFKPDRRIEPATFVRMLVYVKDFLSYPVPFLTSAVTKSWKTVLTH